MHELSLALEVIELVQREAVKNNVTTVAELQIEVGDLSGVEADAFHSALEMLVRDTILANAGIEMIRTPGRGKCHACDSEFVMTHRLDTCPECSSFPSEISGGVEFRVVSMKGE